MPLPEFEFHEPATVDEACRMIGELGEKTKILAGGTDLLVNMKKKLLAPEHLVSLDRIQSLAQPDSSNGSLRIGPCVKAAEMAESDAVALDFPALQEGASKLGSPLIRNLATVGGNLVTARPAADFPPSLIAYGATLVLKSIQGARTVPLMEFIQAPGQTVLSPDEMLEAIVVEKPSPLSEAFDAAYFEALLAPEDVQKLSLKAALATEQRIPGLGNGALQDILWQARLNPRRKVHALTDQEVEALFTNLKTTLAAMTEKGGRSTEKDLFNQPGGYPVVMYAKSKGKPCPRCGDEIQKESYLGGSVYTCPTCQPFE